MKRVKVCCNWTSTEEVTKRLLLQFGHHRFIPVEFVHDNSYDVLFILGHIDHSAGDWGSRPAYLFPQEPSWSGNYQHSFMGVKNLTVYGYRDAEHTVSDSVRIIPMHSLMFYGGCGPHREGWGTWCYKNLHNLTGPKNRFMSSIVSSLSNNYGSKCLYPQRFSLANRLRDEVDLGIDAGGWDKKIDGLREYKFSLAIENSNERDYVSEKFHDCILSNTIPIYFGCKNIRDIYPSGGYILLDDIKDHAAVIAQLAHIRDHADEIYRANLQGLLEVKRKFLEENNPLAFMLALLKNSI